MVSPALHVFTRSNVGWLRISFRQNNSRFHLEPNAFCTRRAANPRQYRLFFTVVWLGAVAGAILPYKSITPLRLLLWLHP